MLAAITNNMKKLLIISFVLLSGICNGQIPQGEYYSYGIVSRGHKMVFLTDNHFMMIVGNDTIGGLGTEINGVLMASKYVLDTTKTPFWIDLIFYDKRTGDELGKKMGLCNIVDEFRLVLFMGSSPNSRPKEINFNHSRLQQLVLNSPDNYVNLLLLNEERTIISFSPDTVIKRPTLHQKEVLYYQNGKLLVSEQFQTKEIQTLDEKGRITKKELFDVDNNLFKNKRGYCKKIINYNDNGDFTLIEYYKTETDLIDYNGSLIPRVKFTYRDDLLIKLDRLLNHDSLKLIEASVTKIIYDSFDDRIDYERYLYNGTKMEDSLQNLLKKEFKLWINTLTLFPNSFELIVVGKPKESKSMSSDVKVVNSEEYNLYTEFYLNDSSNTKQKFMGFIKFDHNFEVIGITAKLKKTGYSRNNSWNYSEFDSWMATFCRKLNAEEKEKQSIKDSESLNDVIEILEEAASGKNPSVHMEGDTDKKALKKTIKALKKAQK